MRTTLRWVGLVTTLLAVAPPTADAQIGALKNRVRKAVGEAVAGGRAAAGVPASVPGAARGAGSVYNEHVLEMTPEVLDRLGTALAAESAARQEVTRLAATVLTEEGFESCMAGLGTDAEAIRLLTDYGARAKAHTTNPSDRAAEEAYKSAQTALGAHAERKCGPQPSRFTSQELPRLQRQAVARAREAGQFTESQYSILKERLAPICSAVPGGPGELKIPGRGKEIFWVYTAAEVEGLRTRCAALGSALSASL